MKSITKKYFTDKKKLFQLKKMALFWLNCLIEKKKFGDGWWETII